MQQEKKKHCVRFSLSDDEDNQNLNDIVKQTNQKNAPIIGINNLFLDPSYVENSMKEEDVILQEDPIIDLNEQSDFQKNYNLDDLHLSLIPHKRSIMVKQQTIPVLFSINTKSGGDKKCDRPAIDLVCVVDVSGSMIGKKINLVKDSLRYLMKILSPQDRLAIVVFSTISHYLTPWLRNTPENKQKLKRVILGMEGLASTNIAAGAQKGLWMLKNRKYKNPVSCMFLLSDGRDDDLNPELRVQDFIQTLQINEKFTINCFGYGHDHDSYVMNQIATYKNGYFYYIEDIKKASDYFILSMSGMLSIVAQNIKAKFIEPFKKDGFLIKKTYGENKIWFKDQDQNHYLLQNYIIQGESRIYIFEIEIPNQIPEGMQQTEQLIKVIVEGNFIKSDQKFEKEVFLILKLDEETQSMNEIVETNYLRTKAGERIGQACVLAGNKQYEQAIQLLDEVILELNHSLFSDSSLIQQTIEDVEKSKTLCKPQLFEKEGQAFMLKKERNHLVRQSSLTNIVDWNDDQQQKMQDLDKGELALSNAGSQCSIDIESDSENISFQFLLDQLKIQQKQLWEEEDQQYRKQIEQGEIGYDNKYKQVVEQDEQKLTHQDIYEQ